MMLLLRILLLAGLSLSTVSAFGLETNRVFVSTPVSKYPKRLVEDYMTRDPYCLSPDLSVDEAMSALLSKGISGAPVVENNKLVGVVSSFDFLRKEAFEGAILPVEGSSNQVEKYVETAQKICGRNVEEVMTHNCITVSPKTSMQKAAAIMTEHNLHRLAVVEENGDLVGILSSVDVMRDLLHVVRNLPPARESEGLDL